LTHGPGLCDTPRVKKKPQPKLPPVIPAPKSLRDAMRRLSQGPPISSAEAKAQTEAVLRIRSEIESNSSALKSGRARKAA